MSQCGEAKPRLYSGWIPVVSGNMSFSSIGRTAPLRGCAVVNEVDRNSGSQSIVIWAKKDSNDGWLWTPVRTAISDKTFEFWYLVHLNSVPEGNRRRGRLEGWIALTPNGHEAPLRALANKLKGTSPPDATVSCEETSMLSGAHWGKVVVHRNGQCDLELSMRHADREEADRIANQFFIFLKDAGHNHYHHREADSITSAHSRDEESSDWTAETLFGLHRAIVSARKYRSQKRLREAMGISAYAEAFEQRVMLKAMPEGVTPTYSYAPVRLSIQMLFDEAKARTDRRLATAIFLASLSVAFVALLAGMNRAPGMSDYALPAGAVAFFGFLIQHPLASLLVVVCAVLVVLILMGGDHFASRLFRSISEKVLAGLAFLPQRLNGSVFLVTALTFFAAAATFVWKIVR